MLFWAMLLAGAGPVENFIGWASFSRAPALAHTSEVVEVETRGVEPSTHDLHLIMRLMRRRLGDVTVSWAESDTCPAVRETVRAMSELAVPHVTTPYDERDVTITLDGTGYSFAGPASGSNGRIAFSSNTGTPLAAWIDARLAALAPCWKAAKP